jgi:hypothetical protein
MVRSQTVNWATYPHGCAVAEFQLQVAGVSIGVYPGLGLRPSNAAPRDKTSVLFRGKVPYILRKIKSKGLENAKIT